MNGLHIDGLVSRPAPVVKPGLGRTDKHLANEKNITFLPAHKGPAQ